jgi:hypothetical protein
MAVDSIEVTESGVVFAEPCMLYGFLVGGTDETNDITITIYDSATAASGIKMVPTFKVDASILGLNGAYWAVGKGAYQGVYVEITTSGTASVVCDISR